MAKTKHAFLRLIIAHIHFKRSDDSAALKKFHSYAALAKLKSKQGKSGDALLKQKKTIKAGKKERVRAWKRGCECESRSTRGRRRWNFYWSTWFISFFTARPLTGIFLLVLAVLYFLLIFLKFFFFFLLLTRHFLWARTCVASGWENGSAFRLWQLQLPFLGEKGQNKWN